MSDHNSRLPVPPAPAPEPVESARDAGLIYVSDRSPGIRRRRAGNGFVYIDPSGKMLHDAEEIYRINCLAIPPAWSDVWICPSPRGHIQAVGRDARGRKQYRYHEKFRAARDQTKYGRMIEFARALPSIRSRVCRDLRKKGLPREKALAAVVRLLESTLIRVGNEEYARENHHYGLTTIHNNHAKVRGPTIRFHFNGKGGIERRVDLRDSQLAKIVRKCQELPGEELFCYVDDEGAVHDVNSEDVNEYLKQISGKAFTAKDFRTWAGTVLAAAALHELEEVNSQNMRKKNVVRAVETVAKRLGNTKAVCRKCYIHPAVIDSYMDGRLREMLGTHGQRFLKPARHLHPEEAAVLALLRECDACGRAK